MQTFGSMAFTNGYLPFGVASECRVAGEECEVHRHEFIELVYVESGDSTHWIDSQSYNVSPGEILLIGYNQTHSFKAHTALKYSNFFIKPEYISQQLANAETIYDIFSFFILDKYFRDNNVRVPVVSFSQIQKAEMDNLVQKMVAESREKQPGYELCLDGYMKLIFSRIIRTFRQSESHSVAKAITPELLEYIDANFTTNLTLISLANKCFYNPAYFGRLFKSTFSKSLKDYISEKRVAYALTLLSDTEETIDRISACVGYENKKQFYKVFRERVGCTPRQYREKIKLGQDDCPTDKTE